MASATLMNRFAKSVNRIGSGPFGSPIVAVVRVETIVEVISVTSLPLEIDDMRCQFPRLQHFFGAYLSNEEYR